MTLMCSFVTMFKNQIRIACKMGTMARLGRFGMAFDDMVDVSKPLWLPNPTNPQELVKQEPLSKKRPPHK
jgi:hypothetical protein